MLQIKHQSFSLFLLFLVFFKSLYYCSEKNNRGGGFLIVVTNKIQSKLISVEIIIELFHLSEIIPSRYVLKNEMTVLEVV